MSSALKETMGIDLLRVALATAMVLAVPLVAMQFTRDVAWTAFDFAAGALLLGVAGLTCLRVGRHLAQRASWQRAAIVAAVALVFAAVWVELAVGVFFSLGS